MGHNFLRYFEIVFFFCVTLIVEESLVRLNNNPGLLCQCCGIYHYHWWTVSINSSLLFSSCRPGFLRTFPLSQITFCVFMSLVPAPDHSECGGSRGDTGWPPSRPRTWPHSGAVLLHTQRCASWHRHTPGDRGLHHTRRVGSLTAGSKSQDWARKRKPKYCGSQNCGSRAWYFRGIWWEQEWGAC